MFQPSLLWRTVFMLLLGSLHLKTSVSQCVPAIPTSEDGACVTLVSNGNLNCSRNIHQNLCPITCATCAPTASPTAGPTSIPTEFPTGVPTTFPTTIAPITESPTGVPSASPIATPTTSPSGHPTTASPSGSPTAIPTQNPTAQPTPVPSGAPTGSPTRSPTSASPSVIALDLSQGGPVDDQSGFCGAMADYSCTAGSVALAIVGGCLVLTLVYIKVWRKFTKEPTDGTTPTVENTREVGWANEGTKQQGTRHYYPTGYAEDPLTVNPLTLMNQDSLTLVDSRASQMYQTPSAVIQAATDTPTSVDTRLSRTVYVSEVQVDGLQLGFLCRHGTGAFVSELNGTFAAEGKLPIRWGQEIIAVNAKDVRSFNPSQIVSEIATAVKGGALAGLRFIAHSYPSVVVVLPMISSREHKQRLEQSMMAISIELKQRSIPLSVVPINDTYARAFPLNHLEEFQRVGLPAVFVDFDFCGYTQGLLNNLTPGKLAKFLHLGSPSGWKHTVTLHRGVHGFGVTLASVSSGGHPSPQDEVIINDVLAQSANDVNLELFVGWQVCTIGGLATCRANFQVQMRGVKEELVLSLRPNDLLSPKAQAHLGLAAKRASMKNSRPVNVKSATPFGAPLAVVLSDMGHLPSGIVNDIDSVDSEKVSLTSVPHETGMSADTASSDLDHAHENKLVAPPDEGSTVSTGVPIRQLSLVTDSERVDSKPPSPTDQIDLTETDITFSRHSTPTPPPIDTTNTDARSHTESESQLEGHSDTELALQPSTKEEESTMADNTDVDDPEEVSPNLESPSQQEELVNVDELEGASATPDSSNEIRPLTPSKLVSDTRLPPKVKKVSREYATEDERVHAEADVDATAARMEEVTFDFTFG